MISRKELFKLETAPLKEGQTGKCKFCGKDCINLENQYFLKDTLWKQLGLEHKDFLCKDCLKKLLGRDIRVADLQVLPINYFNPYLLDEVYSQILSNEEIEIMKKARKVFSKIIDFVESNFKEKEND